MLSWTLAFTVYKPGLYMSTLFSVITIFLVIFFPSTSFADNCNVSKGSNLSPSEIIISFPVNDDLSITTSSLLLLSGLVSTLSSMLLFLFELLLTPLLLLTLLVLLWLKLLPLSSESAVTIWLGV